MTDIRVTKIRKLFISITHGLIHVFKHIKYVSNAAAMLSYLNVGHYEMMTMIIHLKFP